MLRGCWHIVLAVGLALYASLAYSQDQPDAALEREPITEPRQDEGAAARQGDAQNEDRAIPDYTPAFERIESAIRDLVSEKDENARQRQDNREKDDLEAQQNMAFWAKFMFWATVAAVIVTGMGVALVGFTLRHTRRAADYAGDMVKEAKLTTAAANETISVTRDIGQKQARAYVGIGTVTVKMNDDGIIGAVVEIENTGQTPALNVICGVTLTICPFPLRKPLPTPKEPGVLRSSAILHGGKHVTIKGLTLPVPLSPEYQRDFTESKGAFFIHGAITYEDVFGEPHFTKFCLYYTGSWGGEHKPDVYSTGNEAD